MLENGLGTFVNIQFLHIYVERYYSRPAIAWATWDLIAMVEDGKHDGPPTHAVTFVWIGHEVKASVLSLSFTLITFSCYRLR